MSEAEERQTGFGRLRVIGVEGLIAFKLQGYVNDPTRVRDLDDLRALFKANAGQLDMDEVQRYFALFDREDLLEALKDGR